MSIAIAQDRLIWSADVANLPTLLARLDDEPRIKWVKVDRYFVAKHGLGVLDVLRDQGVKVFDDEKIAEIPTKVELLAELYAARRPAMLNCMAGCISNGNYDNFIKETPDSKDERDGLKRFADVCHRYGVRPCGVTVLTSKSDEVVDLEFNGRTAVEQVLYYVEELLLAGFTDVVCSPKEAAAIRAESQFDWLDLNCPGVRLLGTDTRDQQRVTTPFSAIDAGVTRLVVGQNLTDDPSGENCTKILDEITAALAA